MKPSQIIVGKIYINSEHKDALYLGVGKSKSNGFVEKRMVVIRSNNSKLIGCSCVSYPSNPDFWNDFVLTKKKFLV